MPQFCMSTCFIEKLTLDAEPSIVELIAHIVNLNFEDFTVSYWYYKLFNGVNCQFVQKYFKI